MLNEAWHWIWHDDGWIWVWLFWGTIAAFFTGVRDFFIEGWHMLVHGRQEREIALVRERRKLARAEAALEAAKAGQGALPAPGPCTHRRVTPVVAPGDEVVAWLCKNPDCAAQLPKDWAVRAEDM